MLGSNMDTQELSLFSQANTEEQKRTLLNLKREHFALEIFKSFVSSGAIIHNSHIAQSVKYADELISYLEQTEK